MVSRRRHGISCAWPEPECHESSGLTAKPLVLLGVDAGCFGHGAWFQQALDDMVGRCETPSVRAFVRTASRGESLGVSIGPVLRELSSDQRRRRRQAAREKMQKAPIKMLFPLMFLIFPALMIVLMYPAAYSISKNLGGLH